MTKSISTLSIFPPVSGAAIALLRLPFGQQALPGPGNMGALTTLSRLREVVEQDIILLIPLCFYTHRVAHTHTHMNRLLVNNRRHASAAMFARGYPQLVRVLVPPRFFSSCTTTQ